MKPFGVFVSDGSDVLYELSYGRYGTARPSTGNVLDGEVVERRFVIDLLSTHAYNLHFS